MLRGLKFSPESFQYPSTRYSGSKRRLVDWIWTCIKDIPFESVLDVFGGTGTVSLMFKEHGKRVLYNDILRFNQLIGMAVIENCQVVISDEDIDAVLECAEAEYPDFIQREFRGVFFTEEENVWLDQVVTNIAQIQDSYKRAILMASLFQACLAKRPFNLFHRANLSLRTACVNRTFGNKTTWEHPFPDLLRRFVREYNRAVFSNGQDNRAIGGFDALSVPNGVDLVYLDPPYFSANRSQGTNYLFFYSFLEGLADYKNWDGRLGSYNRNFRRIGDTKEIQQFVKKTEILECFSNMLSRFEDNLIVLSYQSDGVPSKDDIKRKLETLGKKVEIFEKFHQYALSSKSTMELLFVAT